jgi:ADP-ribose pyrophosphatase
VSDSTNDGGLLARQVVYRGRRIELDLDRVRLPNDHVVELEIVRHPGAAAIVPLLGEEVIMIRQWRHATGGWLLEIPAGTLSPGEEPAHCAARELEEETGFVSSELIELGWVWSSPGVFSERIWLYLARGLSASAQRLEQDEVLSLERVSWEEAVDRAARGELHDGKSVAALLLAARYLERVERGD